MRIVPSKHGPAGLPAQSPATSPPTMPAIRNRLATACPGFGGTTAVTHFVNVTMVSRLWRPFGSPLASADGMFTRSTDAIVTDVKESSLRQTADASVSRHRHGR